MADKRQVIVLGAGPGGYAAAFQACNLGLDVTLIDPRENPGGVCLFQGCIPTKALLHLASLREEMTKASEFGLGFSDVHVELEKVRNWKDSVVRQLTGGLGQLAKMHKAKTIRGTAKLTGKNKIEVQSDGKKYELEFDYLVLATGASPAGLPDVEFDGDLVMSSKEALELRDIPGKLLVVGAGYIGLEMSMIYRALGSDITIAEFTNDILPGVDQDLKDVFKKDRKDMMSKTMFQTRVTSVRKDSKLHVEFENAKGEKKQGEFDRMLVAVGTRPNTQDIGLDAAGIKTNDRGFVEVDIYRRTSVQNIYAIGDITGQPMLAHKATHEGRVAAQHIAGHKTAYEPKAIPAVVFTVPEIAWTGLTETQAQEQGRKIEIAKFPWAASGRAVALGIKNGLTKLIIDPETDRILGGGIVGRDAGSIIPEITLAIEMGAVVMDLELTIHPHPTLSETIMEAAELYYGSATHVFRKKKNNHKQK